MEYSNPELPENINTSKTNSFKEFIVLTLGLIAAVFILISALIILVDNFADKIPFELEKNLPISGFIKTQNEEPLPPYLESVTTKVIQSFRLPPAMKITVHYVNDNTVNAFATLGGHIVLYRGLIEKLKTEDELAMVIGHEVAHIKYRHPILSASHGVVVSIVLSLVSSSAGDSVVTDLMGSTGMASLMRFSREYEYQSDKEAIASLIKIYGHAGGALGLFKVFEKELGKDSTFEFFATHPLTKNRILKTNDAIAQYRLLTNQKMTALPEEFKQWLKRQKETAKSKSKQGE
ncbi:hypothetical protein MNBD_GAMMA23-2164 [hydrothermal vent metagenome]|uniref:Peptidase M48 domain-containing protein n=1 Tax=hydrothermal vent metagenome TaxID=652676 RepID=A0A3B0ZQX6_9ZZZZ